MGISVCVVGGFFLFIFLLASVSSGSSRSSSRTSTSRSNLQNYSTTSASQNYERLMRKRNVSNKDYTNSYGINVKREHEKMLKMLKEAERRR